MNCQSCNSKIDYRFLSNCAECGYAFDLPGASQLQPLPEVPPLESFQKRPTWKRILVNLVYVLISSLGGMFMGALVLYIGYALLCTAVLNHILLDQTPGAACARGTAMAFLSLVIGSFLGTVGGTAFAVKHPVFKPRTD